MPPALKQRSQERVSDIQVSWQDHTDYALARHGLSGRAAPLATVTGKILPFRRHAEHR